MEAARGGVSVEQGVIADGELSSDPVDVIA